MLRIMITNFDKAYAREVLPMLARQGGDLADTDIVVAHLNSRQMQSPVVLAVVAALAIGAVASFAIALSNGPLVPPGEHGRLVP